MSTNLKFAALGLALALLAIALPVVRTVKANRAAPSAPPTSVADPQAWLRAEHVTQFASNAAYLDGLYQGQLAAKNHSEVATPTGRWSAPQDQDAFGIGYQDGYSLEVQQNLPPVHPR